MTQWHLVTNNEHCSLLPCSWPAMYTCWALEIFFFFFGNFLGMGNTGILARVLAGDWVVCPQSDSPLQWPDGTCISALSSGASTSMNEAIVSPRWLQDSLHSVGNRRRLHSRRLSRMSHIQTSFIMISAWIQEFYILLISGVKKEKWCLSFISSHVTWRGYLLQFSSL